MTLTGDRLLRHESKLPGELSEFVFGILPSSGGRVVGGTGAPVPSLGGPAGLDDPKVLRLVAGVNKIDLRVDLIVCGCGQCLMAQPRETRKPGALEALYDWHMRNVFFNAYLAPVTGLGPAWPILREYDYPFNTKNTLKIWLWRSAIEQPCYRYRERTSADKKGIASGPGWMYLGHLDSAPVWLLQDVFPPSGGFADPGRGECGGHYVSIGYEGKAPAWGPDHLKEMAVP